MDNSNVTFSSLIIILLSCDGLWEPYVWYGERVPTVQTFNISWVGERLDEATILSLNKEHAGRMIAGQKGMALSPFLSPTADPHIPSLQTCPDPDRLRGRIEKSIYIM